MKEVLLEVGLQAVKVLVKRLQEMREQFIRGLQTNKRKQSETQNIKSNEWYKLVND